MNIIGPDALVFGVEDIPQALKFLGDYGLSEVESGPTGGVYEALDGTAVIVRAAADASLPPPVAPSPNIRQIIYGVADAATLDRIAQELGRDREVTRSADGSVQAVDDAGFPLSFRVTTRRKLADAPATPPNFPCVEQGRAVNQPAVNIHMAALPVTLSHVVVFVPDLERALKFYTDRLGFFVTDRFRDDGVFLRPAGTQDHHTLFLLRSPHPSLAGLNHFTFHVSSVNEMLLAGSRFIEKGYQSFWGPGRHIFGSNWFWYFNSPFGGTIEYDADMDRHDASWTPRNEPADVDHSQLLSFAYKQKWFPGGPRN